MAHHGHEFCFCTVRGVRYLPSLSCFSDDGAELFVGEGQLVGELASFVCLVLQLPCLGLESVIAFLEGSHARSGDFTLM